MFLLHEEQANPVVKEFNWLMMSHWSLCTPPTARCTLTHVWKTRVVAAFSSKTIFFPKWMIALTLNPWQTIILLALKFVGQAKRGEFRSRRLRLLEARLDCMLLAHYLRRRSGAS